MNEKMLKVLKLLDQIDESFSLTKRKPPQQRLDELTRFICEARARLKNLLELKDAHELEYEAKTRY